MLSHPIVASVAIACGTLIICAIVAGVVILGINGRSSEALTLGVIAFVAPLLGALWSKVSTVAHQTNGTTSKLVDAVIASGQNGQSTVDTSTPDRATPVGRQRNAA